jgi:hypothetical protein
MDHVVAAVNFARENNLRVVVKGGGHSYQGTSNAADSLLIWMRKMNAVTVHDAFVGAGWRWTTRAAAGGYGRGGRDLGPGLRCGHDEGGSLCPGRRVASALAQSPMG